MPDLRTHIEELDENHPDASLIARQLAGVQDRLVELETTIRSIGVWLQSNHTTGGPR